MGLVIDVPLNTSLADLDEALRTLLKRELDRRGFEGVDISFDAPSRDWAGKLTGPTVSLFLYDLREARDQADISGGENRENGRAVLTSPPLRLEATYAITAWTKAVEDEHRVLSQLLAILHSHRALPGDLLDGRLADAGTIETLVGRPMEEKADFWTAVGGQYKPSIDFAVRISITSGAVFVRGPEVRTQTVQAAQFDRPKHTMTELYRFGGTISDANGAGISDAWVTMPESGVWASSDRAGRFVFDRVRPGIHRLVARTVDGRELAATISVPGERADLVMTASDRRTPPRRSRKA
jgi:Pvc16 N-terminal domain